MGLQDLLNKVGDEIKGALFEANISQHLNLKANPAMAEIRIETERTADAKRFTDYIRGRMCAHPGAGIELEQKYKEWCIRIVSKKDSHVPKDYLIENTLHKLLKEAQQYRLKQVEQRRAA